MKKRNYEKNVWKFLGKIDKESTCSSIFNAEGLTTKQKNNVWWIYRHSKSLRHRYGNKIIAFKNKKTIGEFDSWKETRDYFNTHDITEDVIIFRDGAQQVCSRQLLNMMVWKERDKENSTPLMYVVEDGKWGKPSIYCPYEIFIRAWEAEGEDSVESYIERNPEYRQEKTALLYATQKVRENFCKSTD